MGQSVADCFAHVTPVMRVLSLGRLFGAHMVHNTLQMEWFCASERTLNDSKQIKRGEYEQGRKN
jgi:hypothetical protein